MSKVVLITGASSGVGLSTSVLLAANGYKVYASMRDTAKAGDLKKAAEEKGAQVEVTQLDVTDETSIKKAIDEIIEKEGKIDVLINNAGFSFAKTLEQTSMSEFRSIMETNFFGLVATTKIVVPLMRARRSGHILNISSYGGLVGQPFNDAYCAAKFAVTGLSESMHASLRPFGIKVTLVCPGAITTPFLQKAAGTIETDPSNPYMPLGSAYVATMKKVFSDSETTGVKSSQTADEVAEVLKRLIEEDDPQFLCLTSQYIEKVAGLKLKDTTGKTMANMTLTRSYGADWKNLL